MQLSKYFENILRDGFFDALGIIDSHVDQQILSFIDDKTYIDDLLANKYISCVIATEELSKIIISKSNIGVAIAKNPRLEFFKTHNLLCMNELYIGKKFDTKIKENCQISNLAYISPYNVIIGKNTIIEEFVSIKENTIIGDNCIVRTGTVIGSSGFEYKKEHNSILSVNHVGNVIIGSNVEIKCNTVIDKAIYPWDSTIIDDYSKIDNLVHIAHAVKIGKRVMIPAMSVIGGRVIIKDDSWIGIGSVLRNGIRIGQNSRVNMGSVVTKNVLDGESVSGNWAINHQKFIKLLKERIKITD